MSQHKDINGPEPCITSFATGRCYSPDACSAFGYCRDRNLKFGMPDEATELSWQAEAILSKTGKIA